LSLRMLEQKERGFSQKQSQFFLDGEWGNNHFRKVWTIICIYYIKQLKHIL
jgi:hypothetical protein